MCRAGAGQLPPAATQPARHARRDAAGGTERHRWHGAIYSSPLAYNAKVSAETGTTEVPAVSMPTLLQAQGLAWVDLLKIDIEDYEQQVLAGPTNWLAQVGVLLIGIHSPASQVAVRQAVQAHGFSWEQAAGRQPDTGLFVARNPQRPQASGKQKPSASRLGPVGGSLDKGVAWRLMPTRR